MNGLKDTGSAAVNGVSQAAPQLSGDAMNSLAIIGKTSAALLLVVALIWLCCYLLKRLNQRQFTSGGKLRLVSSCAIGQRERVVVVEIRDTWLVLGVGGGQVNLLHSLDSPEDAPASPTDHNDPESFANRLMRALNRDNRQS